MIQPLQLGNKLFPVNLIQGPLAGVSCAPFRLLTWRYSQPAFTCTEMISSKTLIHTLNHDRFTYKDPHEGPVCFQLSANNPQELAEATKIATARGADLIDLNCGCPVKKIRSKAAGSRHLSDASKLYQLIQAMKQNTAVPVSIKIRVDGESNEIFNHEVAKVVNEAGTDFLVVHGRHWSEHYETPCRHEQIQFFVERLKIPVIGNGDIRCVDSLRKMLATGCAGVMISRAGVGQPWLIAKLLAEMQQKQFITPSWQEIGATFIEHVRQLAALLQSEKFAILQARKFAKYYARELAEKNNFVADINQCESLVDIQNIVAKYFLRTTLTEPAAF